MARISTAVITFERGLNEYTDPTRLEPGYASVLENWVNEADGSLRSKVGWIAQANGGQPVNRQVRGIGFHRTVSIPGVVQPQLENTSPSEAPSASLFVAARSSNNAFDFYRVGKNQLADGAVAMMLADTVTNLNVPEVTGKVASDYYVPMTFAINSLLYGNHLFGSAQAGGLGPGGIRRWKSDNTFEWLAESAANNVQGRTMCFYGDRLFTGGHYANGSRLYWSGLGAITMWNTNDADNPAGILPVAKDNADVIEYITPFQDGILIGKTDSLHYLIGRNPFSAQLERLDAGYAAPGKSIAVTPYGAFICGYNNCWLFDGSSPRPKRQNVISSYGLKGNYMTVEYLDDAVYIADQGKDDILVYDFIRDSWRKERFSPGTGRRLSTLFVRNDRLLGGPYDATDVPLINYRDLPIGTRTPDTTIGTTYRATTPRTWFGNSIGPVTVRHAYLKTRWRGTTGPGLTVRLYRKGALANETVIGPPKAAGVERHRIDTGPTGYEMHWEFEQTLAAGQTSNVDLEEILIEYEKESAR